MSFNFFLNLLPPPRIHQPASLKSSLLQANKQGTMMILFMSYALLLIPMAVAFVPATTTTTTIHARTQAFMAPKYNKETQRWTPSSPEEESSAGYDILGTLLRQGPNPTLQRIFKPDEYDQAVLKFMAGDKCDRNTAQGNMDAYLQNPNDWAYNRLKGYNIDYATLDEKAVLLASIWSALILALAGRAGYSLVTHENFWAFLAIFK